jgi:hypothetical protein
MSKSGGGTGARRLGLLLLLRSSGTAAAAVLLVAVTSCSGNSGRGLHSLSLPQAIGGYTIGNRQASSQGTIHPGPQFTGLLAAKYRKHGSSGGSPSAGAGTILLDTGHLIQIPPGQALSVIYAIGRAGNQTLFGARQAVSAGPLGGQASCWTVRASASSSAAENAAMCAWADSDTFGLLLTSPASPAASPSSLASAMLTFRSAIEKPDCRNYPRSC